MKPTLVGALVVLLGCHDRAEAQGVGTESRADSATHRVDQASLKVQVGAWGDHCGPRPVDVPLPSGARLRLSADEVESTDGGPPLLGPGVCRTATHQRDLIETRSGSTFQCRAPPGAAKQVDGQARRVQAEIVHRMAYTWLLKGSTCEVTIESRYALVALAPPPPAKTCATPGPVVRLTSEQPSTRFVAQDGQTRFSVEGADAQRCVLPVLPTWSTSHGRVSPGGDWQGQGVAAGTVVTVEAHFAELSYPFQLRVRLDPLDLSGLLPQYELPTSKSSTGRTDLPVEAMRLTADRRAELDRQAEVEGRRIYNLIGFGVLVVLCVVGVIVLIRSTHRRRKPTSTQLSEALSSVERSLLERTTSASVLRCPRCESSFPAGTEFCGFDGSRLSVSTSTSTSISISKGQEP